MKRFCLMCLIVVFTMILFLGGCTRKQESTGPEDPNAPVRFFWPPTILQRESFRPLPVLITHLTLVYIIGCSISALTIIITTISTILFLGALWGYPPLRGEAEKPEALKRGGLPPLFMNYRGIILYQ